MEIREFLFPLFLFGYGGKCADSGGRFAGVNESGIFGGGGDVLGVEEMATAEDAVNLEGVKG